MNNDRKNQSTHRLTIPSDAQAKRQFWQTEVKRWHASGQSQRQYCQDRGLVDSQLSYWVNKFHVPSPSSSSASGFTPIRVKPETSLSCIRVRRPNGVCIELPTLQDSVPLKTLLELLIC